MLTVEKIGGTSMSALKEVIDNIIYHGNQLSNRVFVVSAFSGVTNLLLENKKTKAPGVYQKLAMREDFRSELAAVAAHLKELNQQYEYLGLDKEVANDVVDGEMKTALTYLDSAVTMLASGYLNEGILLASAAGVFEASPNMHPVGQAGSKPPGIA